MLKVLCLMTFFYGDVIEREHKEDEKNSDNLEVIFRTEPHGYNAGRSYIYSSAVYVPATLSGQGDQNDMCHGGKK